MSVRAARMYTETLEVILSRFCRIAVEAPWYVRNIVLYDALDIESLSKYLLKTAAEHFFKKVERHDIPLIVTASKYTPSHQSAEFHTGSSQPVAIPIRLLQRHSSSC